MLSAKDSEVPFILTARNMGYYVITTGNKADRAGHKYADEYVPFDFSDYNGLADLAKELHIDALCQGCNDHCALSAAAIGARLGLPGHDSLEVASILHRKDRFKEFAERFELPSPVSAKFDSIEEAMNYGITFSDSYIVKPTDSAGGAGVSEVNSLHEYEKAVRQAFKWSAEGRIVVEPYIRGTLHSLSTFIIDKQVVAHMTANDFSYKNKYLTNSGSFPAVDGDLATEILIPEVERVARELDLTNGLLHLQYIKDSNGRFWIIEMMRRSPGNNYLFGLSRATGINWIEWILKAESGDNLDDFPTVQFANSTYAYHSIMAAKNGVLDTVEIDEDLVRNVYQYTEWKGAESVISDYLNDKIGSIQLSFPSEHQCNEVMTNINDKVRVVLK